MTDDPAAVPDRTTPGDYWMRTWILLPRRVERPVWARIDVRVRRSQQTSWLSPKLDLRPEIVTRHFTPSGANGMLTELLGSAFLRQFEPFDERSAYHFRSSGQVGGLAAALIDCIYEVAR